MAVAHAACQDLAAWIIGLECQLCQEMVHRQQPHCGLVWRAAIAVASHVKAEVHTAVKGVHQLSALADLVAAFVRTRLSKHTCSSATPACLYLCIAC